jgi:hypothetical protein
MKILAKQFSNKCIILMNNFEYSLSVVTGLNFQDIENPCNNSQLHVLNRGARLRLIKRLEVCEFRRIYLRAASPW